MLGETASVSEDGVEVEVLRLHLACLSTTYWFLVTGRESLHYLSLRCPKEQCRGTSTNERQLNGEVQSHARSCEISCRRTSQQQFDRMGFFARFFTAELTK